MLYIVWETKIVWTGCTISALLGTQPRVHGKPRTGDVTPTGGGPVKGYHRVLQWAGENWKGYQRAQRKCLLAILVERAHQQREGDFHRSVRKQKIGSFGFREGQSEALSIVRKRLTQGTAEVQEGTISKRRWWQSEVGRSFWPLGSSMERWWLTKSSLNCKGYVGGRWRTRNVGRRGQQGRGCGRLQGSDHRNLCCWQWPWTKGEEASNMGELRGS